MPRRIRQREEPGRRQEGLGVGGARPQPRWRLTVEAKEEGALVEERLTTPGGQMMAAEQVEEEPEVETENQ